MIDPEVFFNKGFCGLRYGDRVVLEPRHHVIGPFIGGYAMVDGEFFVDVRGDNYRWRNSRWSAYREEMIPGGFAKVRTEDGLVLYCDFVTGMLWTERPDDFLQLEFLHFFRYGEFF